MDFIIGVWHFLFLHENKYSDWSSVYMNIASSLYFPWLALSANKILSFRLNTIKVEAFEWLETSSYAS